MSQLPDEHPDTLLADLSVGGLSLDDRRRVEHHLTGCARCRVRLQSLETTALLLRNLPTAELPRSFLLPATTAPRRAPPRRLLPLSFVSAAAVLFLALGLSLAWSRPAAGTAPSSSAVVQSPPLVNGSAAARGFAAAATSSAAAATTQSPRLAAAGAAQAPLPAAAAARVQQAAVKASVTTPVPTTTSPTPTAAPTAATAAPASPTTAISPPPAQPYQLAFGLGGFACLLIAGVALLRRPRPPRG